MMKRERDEPAERSGARGTSAKVQRTGDAQDRASVEPPPSVELSAGGYSARKTSRQRGASSIRGKDDKPYRVDVYKEGKRFRLESIPSEEGQKQHLMVRISADHLHSTNQKVSSRQLWGTNVYTNDSDLVAVLRHCGYVREGAASRGSISEYNVLVEYSPSISWYPATIRNGIRSREWGHLEDGCSLKILRCTALTRVGTEEELDPVEDEASNAVPTFTPAYFERAIATRSTASHHDRRQKKPQEVTVRYNLCNEPWLKYSMSQVADRGLKPNQLTSARLRTEVLYLETERERFEVALENRPVAEEQPDTDKEELYKFSRCKHIWPLSMLQKLGIPQPEDPELEVLVRGLKWEELQFSPAGIDIRGKRYDIVRIHFALCCPPFQAMNGLKKED